MWNRMTCLLVFVNNNEVTFYATRSWHAGAGAYTLTDGSDENNNNNNNENVIFSES